jgi:hypothetical protein
MLASRIDCPRSGPCAAERSRAAGGPAIRECEARGWMQDRAPIHAHNRAFDIAAEICRLASRRRGGTGLIRRR